MTIEYTWTSDDLRLMGAHYEGKGTCVIETHGMSGNFIENYYAGVIGDKLSANGIGFLYGHNRGHSHVNDIAKKPVRPSDNGWNYTRVGATYELFEDSPNDIQAWINKARDLGYERIILLGHSLGCNKTIYYLSQNPDNPDIVGVVLVSPPDMVGLKNKYQPNHDELAKQAHELVDSGRPRDLLDNEIWEWFRLSAQTYLSLFTEGSPIDNLPVLRDPEVFEQLSTINLPMLCVMGEYDDIEIRNLNDDLALIKTRAINTPSVQTKLISGANHSYENREEELSDVVLNWVKTI